MPRANLVTADCAYAESGKMFEYGCRHSFQRRIRDGVEWCMLASVGIGRCRSRFQVIIAIGHILSIRR